MFQMSALTSRRLWWAKPSTDCDGWVTDWVKIFVLSSLWTLGAVCYCSMREPLLTDTVGCVQFHSVYIDVTLKNIQHLKNSLGTSLAVQWSGLCTLAATAEGGGSVPHWGILWAGCCGQENEVSEWNDFKKIEYFKLFVVIVSLFLSSFLCCSLLAVSVCFVLGIVL